jgi:hypothetical protein
MPSQNDPINCWRLHVAAGSTRDERRARLAECPDEYKTEVRLWVERFFKQKAVSV